MIAEMDNEPKPDILQRLVIACATTVVFIMLTNFTPTRGGAEEFLAILVATYGACLIAIICGWFDWLEF